MKQKIKIRRVNAVGEQFKDLTPNSIHDIIPTPKQYEHLDGVWVWGKTEAVRILPKEYDYVK
ncbi:hypothetical protein [Runella limosa]|uniref:hypothetical protein n=1 Tax=Runella limosa TaxID=370978 RepID=UPI00048BE6A2|nr:hypothetical protein [Runella limosa]